MGFLSASSHRNYRCLTGNFFKRGVLSCVFISVLLLWMTAKDADLGLQIVDLHPNSTDNDTDISCLLTSTTPKFNICLYPVSQDIYISNHLKRSGRWEANLDGFFQEAFHRHPHAVLLDIGANIGYYSHMAAAMGHRVVAVEPMAENVRRFRKSVRLNAAWDKIHLLQNGVSGSRRNMSILMSNNNQGATRIVEMSQDGPRQTVQTILFDDLLTITPAGSTAIIKMDIEGHECQAFEASKRLMLSLYVPYVIMEWDVMFLRRYQQDTACPVKMMRRLTDYLVGLGYHPHDMNAGKPLDPNRSTSSWKRDLYWRHHKEPPLK